MIKTILLATLSVATSLTTAGYSLSGGLDYLDNGEERAQQQPQAGVGAAAPAAPGRMAGMFNDLAQFQGGLQRDLPTIVDANPNPTDGEDANPRALTFTPGEGDDTLGTVISTEPPQDRANRLFLDAATRHNYDVMRTLCSQEVTPTPETVDAVLRPALETANYDLTRNIINAGARPSADVANQILGVAMDKGDYEFVKQMILNTPARPTADMANQILGMAMDRQDMEPGDNDVAHIVFGILVPNPGGLDEYERPAALIAAVREGNKNVVRAYLNREISGVVVDQLRINDALWRAALNGHRDVVEILLPRANQRGIYDALWRAAYNGHRDVVESLLPRANQEGINSYLEGVRNPEIRTLLEAALKKLQAGQGGGGAAGAASGGASGSAATGR